MKWQASAAGGIFAAWRGDGRELFYVAPDARLMAVAVSASSSGLAFGVPRALFRMPAGPYVGAGLFSYAASRDGQRFLMLAWPGEVASSPIVVVVGPTAPGAAKP